MAQECHLAAVLCAFPAQTVLLAPPIGNNSGCESSTRMRLAGGIKFSLCNYTFEIALADEIEQLFTHALFL